MDAEGVRRVLQWYMREYNLTQKDIVDRTGLSKGYISQLLNGCNPTTGNRFFDIRTDTALKFATAMGMSFQELVILSERNNEIRRLPVLSDLDVRDFRDFLTFKKRCSEKTILVRDEIIRGFDAIGYIVGDNTLSPEIMPNDIAIIALTDTFESGDIVLITADVNGVGFARAYKKENAVILCNGSNLEPQLLYMQNQVNNYNILGRVVSIQRNYSKKSIE